MNYGGSRPRRPRHMAVALRIVGGVLRIVRVAALVAQALLSSNCFAFPSFPSQVDIGHPDTFALH